MSDHLPVAVSTVARQMQGTRHLSAEDEVLESCLLGPWLHQNGASLLSQTPMLLGYLLRRCKRVPERGSAFCLLLPTALPVLVCHLTAPS
jgi:hypothetical protein